MCCRVEALKDASAARKLVSLASCEDKGINMYCRWDEIRWASCRRAKSVCADSSLARACWLLSWKRVSRGQPLFLTREWRPKEPNCGLRRRRSTRSDKRMGLPCRPWSVKFDELWAKEHAALPMTNFVERAARTAPSATGDRLQCLSRRSPLHAHRRLASRSLLPAHRTTSYMPRSKDAVVSISLTPRPTGSGWIQHPYSSLEFTE